MKKSDIIAYVAEKEELPVSVAHAVVNLIFLSMAERLMEGGRIELRGFGSFRVRRYESYVGRNPKTGESVAVPQKRLAMFKMGKELVETMNDGHPQRDGT